MGSKITVDAIINNEAKDITINVSQESIVKEATFKIIAYAATMIVLVVTLLAHSAFADNEKSNRFYQSPAFKFFLQNRYKDAEMAFTKDISSTWRDPNAAFYYGETLLRQGKTSDAIAVWKRIGREFPRSKRAKDARDEVLAVAGHGPSRTGPDIGILGFKFDAKGRKYPEVVEVYPDTPAQRAHIQKGDLIEQVDGVPTSTISRDELNDLVFGPPNTRIELAIKRGNTTFKTDLTRIDSEAFFRTHPNIGKIYLAPHPHGAQP